MNTPFGLANLWLEGDAVTRFVAIALLVCSIVTWVILLSRFWDLRNLRKLKPELDQFWRATSYDQGLNAFTNHASNPYYQIAKAASGASTHHQSQSTNHRELLQTLNYSEWMARSLKNSIDGVAAQLQKGLTFLGSTGATAPFIGLFGTVWGIYHALIAISSSGSAQIDQVAGPIGEALIMTALGLAVAIPAVLGFNAINRSNKLLVADLNRFGNDLLAYFVTGARVMSFNLQNDQEESGIMAEINMTPMVDVMLVLLIIFIITLPVIQQAVKVELPKANSVRNEVKPESVQLSIDAQGNIFWNSTPIDLKTFDGYAEKAAQKEPQPEINLRADKSVKYEYVAQVLAASRRAGLTKLGFVTEPN
jgi:biopolymer transport protein ExbB